MSLVNFENITYVYNPKDPNSYNALSGVTFSIEKGDFIALVGKTGSGKSTLIQTLNALLKPTKGYTKVDNFYVTSEKELIKKLKKENHYKSKDFKNYSNLRRKVGMVFQFSEYQLFSETVLKDVMFGPKNFGLNEEEAKKVAIEALHSVGINEYLFDRSPFELSGGQKRRIAIAGVLASSPDILVLDEPTVGLDPLGRQEILSLVDKINNSGVTVIIVTHDMETVMNHAKKVVILHDSKLVKYTTPSELFNDPNIEDYSLEIPAFYKFKKELIKNNYLKDISNCDDLSSLIEVLKK